METVNPNLIVVLVSVVLALYAALLAAIIGILSALWLRMGNVQQEFGELKGALTETTANQQKEIDKLQTGIAGLAREVSEIRAEVIGLNLKVDALQEQMERQYNLLQEQLERNQSQLMRAILAHSHRPDGRPTFDLPPDFEPTPADD